MVDRFAPIEPYDWGLLEVGDGNRIYWETCGNPDGKPAVAVHGGPGSGWSAKVRRQFDPELYRLVVFDQRNCGLSLPHASDPATDLTHNTTAHLSADMERLREHLGIEKWLVYGGSWGATLSLAYAEQHPRRVSEIVLASISTTTPAETDWLYHGLAILFPDAWQRFHDAIPVAERTGRLLADYARLLSGTDRELVRQLAVEWARWEDAVIAGETNGRPGAYSDKSPSALIAFTRITAHYFSHNAWLADGVLVREAHRLAGIPGVLVHGRLDLGCPLGLAAWPLAQAWPDAELVIVESSGHTGSPEFGDHLRRALTDFAARAR
jgi:proline iminopeptidase